MSKNKADNKAKQRRPYVKPGIKSGKAFETMALSCGSDGVPCLLVPPSS